MQKHLLLLLAMCSYLFSGAVTGPAYNWAGAVSGSGTDMVKAVKTDGAGNVYVAGYYAGSNVDFDFSSGSTVLSSVNSGLDIFIAKYSSSGQLQWAKSIGGAGAEEAYDLALDQSGNIWITGYFTDTADFNPSAATNKLGAVGYNDIFLAKYDTSGNYLWAGAMGGPDDDFASAICVNPANGNICITGRFFSIADFNPAAAVKNDTSAGAHDIFIAQYTTAGIFVNERRVGGPGEDFGIDLAIDATGNFLVSGRYAGTVNFNPGGAVSNMTSNGAGDAFLAKYNPSLILSWSVSIGGPNAIDFALGVAVDATGSAYVCGYINGSTDFDPTAGTAIVSAPATNYVSGYVAKYSSAGVYQWVNGYWGTFNTTAFTVALDASSNVYVTGYSEGAFDANPGPDTLRVNTSGHDPYLLKYSTTGLPIWGYPLVNGGNSLGNGLCIDNNSAIYLTGYFNINIDVDISPVNRKLETTTNSQEGFIVKFAECNFPPAPTVSASPSDSICSGFAVSLSASGNGVISWYDSPTAGTCLASGTYNLPNVQSPFVVWAQDSTCGAGARTAKTIYVKQVPNVTATATSGDVCVGTDITLYAGGAISYVWNTGDVNSGATVPTTAVGPLSFVVTGTAANGCVDTATVDVYVNAYPNPELDATDVCAGESTTISDQNFNGDNYTWSTGAVTSTIDVAPSQTTQYYVTVETNAGCQAFDTISVIVNTVDASVTQNGDTLICSQTNGTYQWIDCANGNAVNGETTSSFIATQLGNYAVVVTSNAGCVDTSSCYTAGGVGMAETNAREVSIGPNPFLDIVTIEIETKLTGNEGTMEMFALDGSLVMTLPLTQAITRLDVHRLVSGTYFIRISNGSRPFNAKLVKL